MAEVWFVSYWTGIFVSHFADGHQMWTRGVDLGPNIVAYKRALPQYSGEPPGWPWIGEVWAWLN